MRTPIEQLLEHLAQCREILTIAYQSTPVNVRDMRPGNGGWSVAQIIEHLAITDDLVAKFLAKNSAELGRDECEAVNIGAMLQKRRLMAVLDRGTRVEVREQFVPRHGWRSEDAWQQLQHNRAILIDVIKSADGVPLSRGRFVHHVLGEMNLYEAIAFAGYHEQRHAAQIREVVAQLATVPPLQNNPKS